MRTLPFTPSLFLLCVGRETCFEGFGQGDGFKRIAADRDEDEVCFGDELLLAFASHFEIQFERFRADAPDIDADLQHVVELRSVAKVAFQMRAWQPDIQLVKQHAVRQADGAEKLRFGELEKAYVSTVEDNTRRIHISPTHALFNLIL